MLRLSRSLAVGVFVSLMLASLWARAHAAEFRADKSVHVKSDEVIEGDLYAFGEHVLIEGTVKGDLIAAGRHVVVKGTVEGRRLSGNRCWSKDRSTTCAPGRPVVKSPFRRGQKRRWLPG
jgi:hypothetical protein